MSVTVFPCCLDAKVSAASVIRALLYDGRAACYDFRRIAMPDRVHTSDREFRFALVLTGFVLAGMLWLQAGTGEAVRYDFSGNYIGGWIVSHGGSSKLYDFAVQRQAQQAVFHRSDILPYLHPAFEALLFAPLSRVPYAAAYLIWGGANILLWLWFVVRMRPFTAIGEQPFRHLIACFSFFPLWIAFVHGGMSLALLALYSAAFVALKRGRDAMAGTALGFGLFRYQLVLPFVLICAIGRRWKVVAGFTAVALMLGLASIATSGVGGVTAYVRLLTGMLTNPSDPINALASPGLMTTLRAFFVVTLQGAIPMTWINAAVVLISVLLIAVVGRFWGRAGETGQPGIEILFAAALGTTMIVGVYSLIHDFSLMLLPMILVIGNRELRHNHAWYTSLLACAVLMYFLPLALLFISRGYGFYLLCPVVVAFTWLVLKISAQPAVEAA